MICCSLSAALWPLLQLFVGHLPDVCLKVSVLSGGISSTSLGTHEPFLLLGRALSTFVCIPSSLTSCLYSLGLGEILPDNYA